MSDNTSSANSGQSNNEELAAQIATLFKNGFNFQNQNAKLSDSLKINLSLNSQNYALRSRVIKVAIGGKSKILLNHLTTDPPETTDEQYDQWEQEDLVVFSWLIQNIEPSLANNLTDFPTAKSLWDALVRTYSSGKHKLQTYDLHVKANKIKQKGTSLENLWIVLQGIWGEIERRDPNPMKCSMDIMAYNRIRSEQKLFQFLAALDQKHDSIKREILRWDPLPSAEEAYAAVRKETAHQQILGHGSDTIQQEQGIVIGLATTKEVEGSGLATKSYQHRNTSFPSRMEKSYLKCSRCGKKRHTIDQRFEIKGYPERWNDGHQKGMVATTVGNQETTSSGGLHQTMANKSNDVGFIAVVYTDMATTSHEGLFNGSTINEPNNEKTKLKLRPNNKKGVKPDGSVGLNKQPKNNSLFEYGLGLFNKGFGGLTKRVRPKTSVWTRYKGPKIKLDNFKPKSTISCQNPYTVLQKLQDNDTFSKVNVVSNKPKSTSWILDYGATDTMTFDEKDIVFKTKPRKNKVQTANGEIIHVKNGGTIEISPKIKLPNCLYIPALSHKLLSDIRTGLLIGRGTKNGGLYYVDEVSQQGTVSLAHKTPMKEAWLWHRSIEPGIFGCSVFVHIPKNERTKLDPCAKKCVMVGYGINQKGYRCYSRKRRHVFTTMNCDFIETEYFHNTQLTSEGEKEDNDTLSWIQWSPNIDNIQIRISNPENTQHPTLNPENIQVPTSNPETNQDPEQTNHDYEPTIQEPSTTEPTVLEDQYNSTSDANITPNETSKNMSCHNEPIEAYHQRDIL
ncbi:uncharacterized protein [Rutidosis leptorrhynchoides]|uniref:uncharacterized protein n=1 Tax=Rutidosis leptorrhynchoides TaxID=125765 RepID=UPI003A99FB31